MWAGCEVVRQGRGEGWEGEQRKAMEVAMTCNEQKMSEFGKCNSMFCYLI